MVSIWHESPAQLSSLPYSPSRLVIFLMYNGYADQLRSASGSCLVCFQHGLDVRLPTPEQHTCGPLCGLHYAQSSAGSASRLPVEVQRILLKLNAVVGNGLGTIARTMRGGDKVRPSIKAAPNQRKDRSCKIFFAGAVRGRQSSERAELLKLRTAPGACVRNTASPDEPKVCKS